MPVAIPIIAAFASGAVGAVIAGTATFAAYATVAGAVLSVAGAVTHNKDLMRIGAIVGIVGGAASLINGASTVAGEAAAPGIDEAVKAGDYVNSADAASDAAYAARTSAIEPPTPPPGMDTAVPATQIPDSNALAPPGTATPASLAQQAGAAPPAVTTDPTTSLASQATGQPAQGADLPSGQDLSADAGRAGRNALQNAAKQFTSSDLNSWWDKATKAGRAVGDFMNQNKEIVNLAGGLLKNIPASQALDYQRSLMDDARRNINSPVPLQIRKA
jgi:hypothetical protein